MAFSSAPNPLHPRPRGKGIRLRPRAGGTISAVSKEIGTTPAATGHGAGGKNAERLADDICTGEGGSSECRVRAEVNAAASTCTQGAIVDQPRVVAVLDQVQRARRAGADTHPAGGAVNSRELHRSGLYKHFSGVLILLRRQLPRAQKVRQGLDELRHLGCRRVHGEIAPRAEAED